MTQITLVICPSFGFFRVPRVVGEAGKVKNFRFLTLRSENV